ncbi:hypothetical protein Bca52824_080248 [Brassica carinata]|uniref:Uncharacterized protein n=1 Tax=Brassica carinata TaxID=52824 RepID=A0A8X7U0V4_BRACI|nr:hypothetical protein Bca52824_080248 [Brassica carinata]
MEAATKKEEIKKGPWKAEEDEVLINHVKRYGPRDWSSIRSKGLLQRTGKSCRLRWVNKLRPNLKNGCKFSAEEEKTVIDLQSQFGNKWARIATYLPGRTDNDVKNFWSSRLKRLARILHNSSDASSSCFNPKPNKGKNVKPIRSQSFGLVEEETRASSSSCSKILPYSSSASDQVDEETLRSPELGIKLENHQPFTFGTDLDDPFFYDMLGVPADSTEPLFALPQPFFEPSPAPGRFRHVSKDDEVSDVFLSRKSPGSLKLAVKSVLGIQKEGGSGKYLGLPEHFGRNKKDLFSSIVDRIKQKASSWSNRHLSSGGKMVMLRSVLSPIPSHAMTCFKLPVSLCKRIQSELTRFWWSGGSGNRKMAWVAWSKMTLPKDQGGLDFATSRV